MSSIFRALAVVTCTTAWTATGVAATEYQCEKKDSSLRIAIEVKKAGHTLPCEVVAEDDRGERAVLYKAQYDREYCPSRIEKTRTELELEGWSCEKTSDTNIVSQQSAPTTDETEQTAVEPDADALADDGAETDNSRVVAASHQCRQGGALRRIQIEVENPTRGKPCELIYWADGDQNGPGRLLWRAEHDADFCPRRLDSLIDKWTSEGWQCDTSAAVTTARAAPVPEPKAEANQASAVVDTRQEEERQQTASDSVLETIIAADAERIGEWMEVEPAIEIAARGDLNDDGSDDAVVFLAYQSEQAAYRQYLMSYLVSEDGYELASVKLLTGVGPPPDQARVEEIDQGVIWLTIPSENGSTPAPTGYRLHDQQLVEVAAKISTED